MLFSHYAYYAFLYLYMTLFNIITEYNPSMVHKMSYEIKGLLDNKSILLIFIL